MLDTLRQRFRGRTWTPVTLGLSGARVWHLDGRPELYVKTTEHDQTREVDALDREVERLHWLAAEGMPVPEVVDLGRDDQFAWLVTSAVDGRTAADPWPGPRRNAVIDALADMALALHALPIADCPFDRGLAVSMPAALRAADDGLVDLDDLDAERAGWSASQLADALIATRPQIEDTVVCHGDFCLPNVLLDEAALTVTGLIDVGRAGLADRHSDVADMARSIGHEMNDQFGERYAQRFIRRYEEGAGVSIDRAKLRFYRLLDEFF